MRPPGAEDLDEDGVAVRAARNCEVDVSKDDPHAAPNPAGAVLEQFGQTWTASLDLWSAWADAWGKILQTRGAPAAEAVAGKLLNPASWPGGLQPLAEEF